MLTYYISKSRNNKTCYVAAYDNYQVLIVENISGCRTGDCRYEYKLQVLDSQGKVEILDSYLTLVDAQDAAEEYLTEQPIVVEQSIVTEQPVIVEQPIIVEQI